MMKSPKMLMTLCGLSHVLILSTNALAIGENNYACKSTIHPNPVVLIHGLFCNADYMDAIAAYLQANHFCTYATTYGAQPTNPFIGGLKSINESASVLADFITSVKTSTGASNIDLVGHSEGAFMTLYVPKFESSVTPFIDKVISIAPPSYGTTIGGISTLIDAFGKQTADEVSSLIDTFGCDACTDVERPGGFAVMELDHGPIAQSGVEYHIIASTHDEVVTPVWTAFVNETGVTNFYIQDRCTADLTGHLAEPFDPNVIQQVAYYLDPKLKPSSLCSVGGAPLR